MVDAREYHERSNHDPESIRADSFRLDRSIMPRPYKRYSDLDRVSLPAPGGIETPALSAVDRRTSSPPQSNDGPPDLPTLCHYATGITKTIDRGGQSMRFRAAACTGKLYHIDLYPVVGPGGPIEPGVYHYDPIEHALDRLRSGDHREVIGKALGPRGRTAPVTVVAASEWWRNAWKYRERTYRHAFWDSGTILANLLAGAHGLGHSAEIHAGFHDDRLVELLGLDPDEEAPVAAVPIGEGAPAPPSKSLEVIDPATDPVSEESVDYPLVPDAWRQSRLGDLESVRDWRERVSAARSNDSRRSDGPATGPALDPVDGETASARPLDLTIDRRGSLREYSHDSISRRLAATVLDRALGGLPIDGVAAGGDGSLLEPYCLMLGVADVPVATYRYHRNEDRLERVSEVDRRTAGRLALDQPVVGDAAVNVYLTADVDAIVDRLGNRGYRLAQLEAGLSLGRLYLATYAHRRLGGRGFTFYDRPVADHLGGDRWPLTMFAFGRRPTE